MLSVCGCARVCLRRNDVCGRKRKAEADFLGCFSILTTANRRPSELQLASHPSLWISRGTLAGAQVDSRQIRREEKEQRVNQGELTDLQFAIRRKCIQKKPALLRVMTRGGDKRVSDAEANNAKRKE